MNPICLLSMNLSFTLFFFSTQLSQKSVPFFCSGIYRTISFKKETFIYPLVMLNFLFVFLCGLFLSSVSALGPHVL